MIETVMTAQMPVGLPIKIKKNRLEKSHKQRKMGWKSCETDV